MKNETAVIYAAGEQKDEETSRIRIRERIAETGFRGEINPELENRLVRMDRKTQFVDDSRMIAQGFSRIIRYLGRKYPKYISYWFAADREVEGRMAALLHDVGKSGPHTATPEQQDAIIELFSLEEPQPTETLRSVVMRTFPPGQQEKILDALDGCRLDGDMAMREFWDKHAVWTRDILETFSDGLNQNIRILAASHHVDRGINPYNIPQPSSPLDMNGLEDRSGLISKRLVMILDKYQAAIRRGKADHETAMEWVRTALRRNYKDDEVSAMILDAVDELACRGELFSEPGKKDSYADAA